MGVYGESLANRRLILLAVLSLIASLLVAGFNAPAASADDELVAFVSAGPTNVAESVGTVNLDIQVTSTDPFLGDVTFDITTGGTASFGTDYTLSDTDFTFTAAGTQTLTVTIDNNAVFEGSESIVLGFTNILPVTAGPGTNASHTINVNDDADEPSISIDSPGAVTEGSPITFTVTRSGASEVDIDFNATTTPDTASAGDFTNAFTNPLTIPGGATDDVTFQVNTTGDSTYENQESFDVSLGSIVGATGGTTATVGLINDNDSEPSISINSPAAVTEGSPITFTVTRSSASEVDITFNATTTPDTASAGDFSNNFTNPLTIPGGVDNDVTFQVNTVADGVYEGGQESFDASIGSIVGASGGTTATVGLINDADSEPSVSINSPAAVTEGSPITFTVTRSADSDVEITFNATTTPDTASAGDFSNNFTNPLTIPGGVDNDVTFQVNTVADGVYEGGQESFDASIGSIVGASGGTTATVGLINDAEGPPTVSVSSFSVDEDAGTADVVVTRSGDDTEAAITFDYATADGTAQSGATLDYLDTNGIGASIAPGLPGTATIEVPINDDDIDESGETFTFTISNVSPNAGLGNAVATITITDDDTAGVILTPTAVTAFEGGTNGTYDVELRTEPTHDVVITLSPAGTQAIAEATADPGNNQLTFTPATWNLPQSVTVTADDDNIDDDGVGESIGHTGLSTDPNYTGSFGNVAVTIEDNDTAGVTIVPTDVSATEGQPGDTYQVSLDSEPTHPVTITLTELGGSEFDVSPSTLVFAPTDGAKTVTVTAVDDAIADGNSTGSISHSESSTDPNYDNGFVGTVDVTIIDDETPNITISGSPIATEGGANGTYTVALTTMPSGPVSVALSPTAGAGEFTIVTASPLTFTASDFADPQTVEVAAVNDVIIDGQQSGVINHVATGGGYNIADPQEVSVTVNDNDVAGAVVVESGGTTVVIEGGATDTYTVALTAKPKANVTVTAVPDAQVDVTPLARTFTPANWNVPQTFTVAGKSDGIDEQPTHPGSVQHATTSSDPDFDALAVDTVIVSISDVDELLVTIDGPTFGAPGEVSVFTAMVNAGATGTITYDWTVFFEGNPVASGDQSTFQFTPANGGPHIVRALVGDDQGQNPAVFIQFTALGDIGGNVFAADIIWLAEEGITKGCNPPINDQFCPSDTVTRGQMAAFLVRFLDLKAIDSGISFDDTAGNIFEQDILKLATAGITRGCNVDGTSFCPNDGVTRGQMAAFLVRAFSLTDNGGGDLFTDDDNSIFEDDIDKLATAKITLGCNPPTNSNFCPTLTVTRGQMAAFLHRAEGLLP